MLDEREQKMLGVYTMVVLIGETWPFPDHTTIGVYSLIPEEYTAGWLPQLIEDCVFLSMVEHK